MRSDFQQKFLFSQSVRQWAARALLVLALLLPLAAGAQPAPPHRRLTLESFEFAGNSKTKPEVIRRRVGLEIGDEITPEIIERSRLRLERTNFFKEVSVYARPGSAKGRIVLIVEVKERRWPYFQFEGGHNDLDGWYFVPASLRFDNAFGHGRRFGLKWYLGDRQSKLSLSYGAEIFGRFDFSAEVFGANKDFIHYLNSLRASQNVNYGGLALRVSGKSGFLRHVFFGYRTLSFDPDNFARREDNARIEGGVLPASVADDLGKRTFQTLTLGLRLDTRDNPVYPLKGVWGAFTSELSDETKGGTAQFTKLTLDARAYQRIDSERVFAFHAKAGYITRFSPFYERFYLGGANSLRGYRERRLTPTGWGAKLFLTNAELRFPLSKERFPYHRSTGVVFFDAGGIWRNGQKPRFGDLRASVGVGVRIKLPIIGIGRFDFAIPLSKIDQNDFKFHISLGHTF